MTPDEADRMLRRRRGAAPAGRAAQRCRRIELARSPARGACAGAPAMPAACRTRRWRSSCCVASAIRTRSPTAIVRRASPSSRLRNRECLLALSLGGVALQWAVSLPLAFADLPGQDRLALLGRWWVSYGLGAFWWPGFLVVIAMVAAWISQNARSAAPMEAARHRPRHDQSRSLDTRHRGCDWRDRLSSSCCRGRSATCRIPTSQRR